MITDCPTVNGSYWRLYFSFKFTILRLPYGQIRMVTQQKRTNNWICSYKLERENMWIHNFSHWFLNVWKGEKMCEIIFSVEKYVNSQLFTLVSQCVKRWEKVRKVVNSHVKKWEKLWIHMWKYFHTFSQFWPYFSLHCEFAVNSQWREKLWKYFLTLVLTFKGYVLYDGYTKTTN